MWNPFSETNDTVPRFTWTELGLARAVLAEPEVDVVNLLGDVLVVNFSRTFHGALFGCQLYSGELFGGEGAARAAAAEVDDFYL